MRCCPPFPSPSPFSPFARLFRQAWRCSAVDTQKCCLLPSSLGRPPLPPARPPALPVCCASPSVACDTFNPPPTPSLDRKRPEHVRVCATCLLGIPSCPLRHPLSFPLFPTRPHQGIGRRRPRPPPPDLPSLFEHSDSDGTIDPATTPPPPTRGFPPQPGCLAAGVPLFDKEEDGGRWVREGGARYVWGGAVSVYCWWTGAHQ